jgi:hypothetical protein
MMLDRRAFIKIGAGALGTLLVPFDLKAADPEDPHFFLQIYIYGGIDSLFLFDGRPLEMRGAGITHAYLKEDPKVWRGDNGGQCLATSMARKLEPIRQRFSIVNGVHMTTAFDGHLQNVNFLYTGNPFGGECFIPHLNLREKNGYTPRPLDAIQISGFALDQTNGGKSIPLSPDSAYNLIDSIKKSRPMDPRHAVMAQMDSRFEALGYGEGYLSKASRQMREAYAHSPDLARKLEKLKLAKPSPSADPEQAFIEMMAGFFKEGICGSAVLEINAPRDHLDVHAASLAKHQVEMYGGVAETVKKVFELLANTPYDDSRSLIDVTTVMFASEFGRTLRQPGLPLDQTGTDHNSLNNSILIGGKGIKPGLVVGESDWRTPGEKLSPTHKLIDPGGIKFMGKPFDFQTYRPRQDLPAVFDADNYLNMASVINTVYSLFSVPQSKWRTVKRDGPKAPVLANLLR